MLDSIRKNASNWGIKVAFAVIIVVFILGFGFSQSGRSAVVATVGDASILVKDFQAYLIQAKENLRRQNPNITSEDLTRMRFNEQVLNEMVTTLLLRQEAKRLGIDVSPAQMLKEIASMPAFQDDSGAFNRERYEQVLSVQGYTPARFEDEFRRSMVIGRLRDYVALPAGVEEAEARDVFTYAREQLTIDYLDYVWLDYGAEHEPAAEALQSFYAEHKDQYKLPPRVRIDYLAFTPGALSKIMDVSADEVKSFYEKNGERYFFQEEEVKARHILLTLDPNAPEAEVKKADAKLLEIMALAKKGEDFAELAKKHSQGPTSVNGGDLGWFAKGQMVPEFEEAAFALKPGEVSEPVRTQFGLHLIKAEERKDAHMKPLADVEEDIRKMLAEEKASDQLSDLLDVALEQVASGAELPAIATDMGLEIKHTELFSRGEAQALLGLDDKSADRLFQAPMQTLMDSPLSVTRGFLVAYVAESVPEQFQSFEEVKPQVVEQVKRQYGMDQARQAADAALKGLAEGGPTDAQKEALATSQPFGRQGFIPGLGMNPGLVGAAFAAQVGQWLPTSYQTGTGYVLARLSERIAPTEEQWNEEKDLWISQLTQAKQRDLFIAYIEELRRQAQVEVVSPEYLQ